MTLKGVGDSGWLEGINLAAEIAGKSVAEGTPSWWPRCPTGPPPQETTYLFVSQVLTRASGAYIS